MGSSLKMKEQNTRHHEELLPLKIATITDSGIHEAQSCFQKDIIDSFLSQHHILNLVGFFWTTTYFSPKIICQPNVWTPTQSLFFEVKGITKNSVSLVRGLCTSIYHETISLPKPFCHTISCLHLVVPIFIVESLLLKNVSLVSVLVKVHGTK